MDQETDKRQIFALARNFVLNEKARELPEQEHCLYRAALQFKGPLAQTAARQFAERYAEEFLAGLD